jgi:hypothetical protein
VQRVDKLLIEGGIPLSGEIAISGAKNAALPILCASLLSSEPLHLTNVPRLKDIATMLRLLVQMGVDVEDLGDDGLVLNSCGLDNPLAPLRHGQDHACGDPGPRPAGRAPWRGAGLLARWLRNRRATGRAAHQGVTGNGRASCASSMVTSMPRPAPKPGSAVWPAHGFSPTWSPSPGPKI